MWRRTQVAKGEVCKTSIHRFESGRRLNQFKELAGEEDGRVAKVVAVWGEAFLLRKP